MRPLSGGEAFSCQCRVSAKGKVMEKIETGPLGRDVFNYEYDAAGHQRHIATQPGFAALPRNILPARSGQMSMTESAQAFIMDTTPAWTAPCLPMERIFDITTAMS